MLSPKLQAPIAASLLFVIVSHPATYKFMHDTIGIPVLKTKFIESGVPTRTGLFIHALVFFGLVYSFLQSK
jgi:hypothetical protein